jgi:hypothetical protein
VVQFTAPPPPPDAAAVTVNVTLVAADVPAALLHTSV